jgi:hypothetical protein
MTTVLSNGYFEIEETEFFQTGATLVTQIDLKLGGSLFERTVWKYV